MAGWRIGHTQVKDGRVELGRECIAAGWVGHKVVFTSVILLYLRFRNDKHFL